LRPSFYTHSPIQEWRLYADKTWDSADGRSLLYIYYRYFFQKVSQPDLDCRPEDFSIFNPKVIEMAHANGDMKPPAGESVPVRSSSVPVPQPESAAKSVRKRSTELAGSQDTVKKPKTVLNSYTIPATVVDLSDDSDDDIGKSVTVTDDTPTVPRTTIPRTTIPRTTIPRTTLPRSDNP
jgi:hypothetical protein